MGAAKRFVLRTRRSTAARREDGERRDARALIALDQLVELLIIIDLIWHLIGCVDRGCGTGPGVSWRHARRVPQSTVERGRMRNKDPSGGRESIYMAIFSVIGRF